MSVVDCASVSSGRLWAPTIFDFDASGLALAALYATAIASASYRLYAEGGKATFDRDAIRFWAIALGVLVLLLANRIFNLQYLATIIGRCESLGGAWYSDRRPIQLALIMTIAGLGLWGGLIVFRQSKESDRRLAALGLSAAIAFVAIRSISYHAAEALLRLRFAGLSLNGLIEAGTIAPVVVGALRGRPRY